MKLDNDSISTLIQLGFSPNQAKVYLALVMLKTATAKSICKFSGVAREEVYRKLNELKKLGFIERIFARPAMFRATPLKLVIEDMLKHKAEEISNLQVKTEKLLRNFVWTRKKGKMQTEIPEFILIPEHRPLFESLKKELEIIENSLDTVCSWTKGIGWMSSHHDLFMSALNRNVKIRFIIENCEGCSFPNFVEELQNNTSFQIKTIEVLPPACIDLYDQKLLFIDTLTNTSFIESPVLWSNNAAIVSMAQVYFETLWTNSS